MNLVTLKQALRKFGYTIDISTSCLSNIYETGGSKHIGFVRHNSAKNTPLVPWKKISSGNKEFLTQCLIHGIKVECSNTAQAKPRPNYET